MGLMDSLKKACKTKGQEMVREALEGKDGSRAPDDAEAYAEKVAEAISADVRCVLYPTSSPLLNTVRCSRPQPCTSSYRVTFSGSESSVIL